MVKFDEYGQWREFEEEVIYVFGHCEKILTEYYFIKERFTGEYPENIR